MKLLTNKRSSGRCALAAPQFKNGALAIPISSRPIKSDNQPAQRLGIFGIQDINLVTESLKADSTNLIRHDLCRSVLTLYLQPMRPTWMQRGRQWAYDGKTAYVHRARANHDAWASFSRFASLGWIKRDPIDSVAHNHRGQSEKSSSGSPSATAGAHASSSSCTQPSRAISAKESSKLNFVELPHCKRRPFSVSVNCTSPTN